MKIRKAVYLLALSVFFSGACQKSQPTEKPEPVKAGNSLFESDNLVAWCVVPFDNLNRGPVERAVMLNELGFKKFAYDWRDQHLPTFPEEIKALEANDIELTSVWWWIDGQGESLLNDGNAQLLHYLDSMKVSCDIWMSFDERFFEGLEDMEKLEHATEAVLELHQKASAVGATLQLYNHGAWFGDPRNQVAIIKKSGLTDVGIIYNFHHAHAQIDEFPELLEIMLPYLNTVNINGMNVNGPKILTVGQGESEDIMLKTLAASGFDGYIGIIGHLEDEDVKEVLERNLEGLNKVTSKF
jgi:sugar phosphate isomerase/epimerase